MGGLFRGNRKTRKRGGGLTRHDRHDHGHPRPRPHPNKDKPKPPKRKRPNRPEALTILSIKQID